MVGGAVQLVSLGLSTGLRGTQRHLGLWWLRAVLRSVRLAYRRLHRCRLPLWGLRWGLQQVQSVSLSYLKHERPCLGACACCLSLCCVCNTNIPATLEKQGCRPSVTNDSPLQGLQSLPSTETITVLPSAKSAISYSHAAHGWVPDALRGGQVALRWLRWA